MAASNTRFTQNSLGQSKNPIDSDHGTYRQSHRDVADHRPPGPRMLLMGPSRSPGSHLLGSHLLDSHAALYRALVCASVDDVLGHSSTAV